MRRPLRLAILSMETPESACAYVRLLHPLERFGAELEIAWCCAIRDGVVRVDTGSLELADVILVQRVFPHANSARLLEDLLASGRPLVYECDDLLTEVPDWNPNVEIVQKCAPHIRELIARASLVTLSTPELASALAGSAGRVVVVPNCVDTRIFRARLPDHEGPVVIGYAGTPTHLADLMRVEDVLCELQAHYGERIRFVFMGCVTDRLRELPGASYAPAKQDYLEYAKALSASEIDIGIAPLIEHPFNRCKSDIKWMEYAACGIPCVASAIPSYASAIEQNRDGVLVGSSASDWFDALRVLIENPDLRRRMGDAALLSVRYHNELRARLPSIGSSIRELVADAAAKSTGRRGGEPREPLCSVVIPAYGRLDLTRQCLERLIELRSDRVELILVDDGSPDDTSDYVRSLSPDVRLVRSEENSGFSEACNRGARAARGRYLVFLNNDTIPQPGWLEPLVDVVDRNPEVGIVGSKLLYPNGHVQHAGIVFSRPYGVPYLAYRASPADLPGACRQRDVQAVTAAAMLIRRELFEELGGFDTGYRNGFEDIDLCLRARAQGARVVFEPESVLVHLEEQSEGRKGHDAQNMARFFERCVGKYFIDETSHLLIDDIEVCDLVGSATDERIYRRIVHPDVRASWERVALAELALRDGDTRLIERCLAHPEGWPSDRGALRWGGMLARLVGAADAVHVLDRRLAEALPREPSCVTATSQHPREAAREEPTAPRVSVVAYVRDSEEWIGELIESVLAQTFRDFELCVLDDGSTDATLEIVRRYTHDARLRVSTQEPRGRERLHETFNVCVAASRGELIAIANGDDRWHPEKLALQVRLMEAQPEIDVCFHDAKFVDAHGTPIAGSFAPRVPLDRLRSGRLGPDMFDHDVVPNPTVMFRREVVRCVGLQEYGWSHDYQFWLKAAVAGCRFHFMADRLIAYRVHERSHSTASRRLPRLRAEAQRMKREMRRRYSIDELYPEIGACADAERARAAAHFDLGLRFLLGSDPVPDLAELELRAALRLAPCRQVEHDLGLALLLQGLHAEARKHLDLSRGAEPYVELDLGDELWRLRSGPALHAMERSPAASFVTVFDARSGKQDVRSLLRAYFEAFALHPSSSCLVVLTTDALWTATFVDLHAEVTRDMGLEDAASAPIYLQQVPRAALDSVMRARLLEVAAVISLDARAAGDDGAREPVSDRAASPGDAEADWARCARAAGRAWLVRPSADELRRSLRVSGLTPTESRAAHLVHRDVGTKVLMVLHNYFGDMGGTERYTRELGLGLRRRGFDVTIFSPGSLQGPERPVLRHSEDAGLRVVSMELQQEPSLDSSLQSAAIEQSFAEFLDREGFEVIHFQHTWRGLPFSLLPIAKATGAKLFASLHDFWFLCAQTHLLPPHSKYACSGPETSSKCARCVVKGMGVRATPAQLDLCAQMLEQRATLALGGLRLCEKVTAPSRFVVRMFEAHGVEPGRIEVQPLGLPRLRVAPRERGAEITFGFMGTLVALKGPDILVRAFADVHGPAALRLHGRYERSCLEQLEPLIARDSRVEYMGGYAFDDLPRVLASFDVLVQPSRIETYSLVAREALAAGIPVIAFAVGAIPELIEDGRNGFLIEAEDQTGLTRAMQRIVDDPAWIERLRGGADVVRTIDADVELWADRYTSSASVRR